MSSSQHVQAPEHRCGAEVGGGGGGCVMKAERVCRSVPGHRSYREVGEGGGGWHEAVVLVCLPLAAPIGLSPLHTPTLRGPERGLIVSTGPPDDLSCLTTPGVGRPRDGVLPVPLTRCIQMHRFADSSTDLCALVCASAEGGCDLMKKQTHANICRGGGGGQKGQRSIEMRTGAEVMQHPHPPPPPPQALVAQGQGDPRRRNQRMATRSNSPGPRRPKNGRRIEEGGSRHIDGGPCLQVLKAHPPNTTEATHHLRGHQTFHRSRGHAVLPRRHTSQYGR